MCCRLGEIDLGMAFSAGHIPVLANQRKVRGRMVEALRNTYDVPSPVRVTATAVLPECSRVGIFVAAAARA